MSVRLIQTYCGDYVAIQRARKNTYVVFQFSHHSRTWGVLTTPLLVLTKNRQLVEPASAFLNIRTSHALYRNDFIQMSFMAYGDYLIWNDQIIPILTKTSANSLSQTILNFDHPALPCPLPPTTRDLWTMQAAQFPAPAPNTNIIPHRVAQLLVDDARKKDEVCPITMDDLGPNVSITSCYHIFDTNALQTWLQTNPKCPVCRENTVVAATTT